MQTPSGAPARSHQEYFHRDWDHLSNPHVRTLAWLLDAPDLLDAQAEEWRGKVAHLDPPDPATRAWLAELDRAPQALESSLGLQPFTRLGRYAESLMAFYLAHAGILFAHGVPVRSEKKETIGEFDFLIRRGEGLAHWEFATKLYLLESSGLGHHADYFVGPNLADTLGAKIRKIMDRQLGLSRHHAAQSQLPLPVTAAEALVKGWLFYHGKTPVPEQPPGIAPAHCRGFWCTMEEAAQIDAPAFAVLPRLAWLAPAKLPPHDGVEKEGLENLLERHFAGNQTPALVALLEHRNGWLLETDRAFIVPNDWQSRAETRVRQVS